MDGLGSEDDKGAGNLKETLLQRRRSLSLSFRPLSARLM